MNPGRLTDTQHASSNKHTSYEHGGYEPGHLVRGVFVCIIFPVRS